MLLCFRPEKQKRRAVREETRDGSEHHQRLRERVGYSALLPAKSWAGHGTEVWLRDGLWRATSLFQLAWNMVPLSIDIEIIPPTPIFSRPLCPKPNIQLPRHSPLQALYSLSSPETAPQFPGSHARGYRHGRRLFRLVQRRYGWSSRRDN